MMRRILLAFSVTVMTFALFAQAADPPKAAKSDDRTPKSIQEEARLKQEILARQFQEFELQMLQVANRMLSSSKQEDREKGQVLMEAIKLANAEGVDVRFQKLVEMLKTSKAANLQDVQEAITQAELLTKNLRAILSLLVNDTRDAQIKAEKDRIQNLLKELNKIIRDQKIVQVNTKRGTDAERAAEDQDRVTRATNELARAMGGKAVEPPKGEARGEGRKGNNKGEAKEDTRGPKGESRNNEGKNTDGKEGKEGKNGDGKEGKEGKGGDGKEGKPGEGKAGEGKEGKAGEGKEGKGGDGKEGKGGEGKGGDPKAGEGKGGEGKPGKGQDGKEGKAGEGKGGDGKEGKGGEGKEGKGGDGKGGDGKAGEGKEGKGGEGKGGEGKSGEGKGGDPKAGEGKGGGKSGEGKGGDPKAGGDGKGGEGKGGEGKGGDPKAGGDGKGGEGKGGEGKGGDPKAGGDGKGGDGKGGEGKGQAQGKGQGKGGDGKGAGKAAGEAKGAGKGGDGKGGDGKGGDGKGGDGKGGDGKGGDGKGGDGKGGQGKGGQGQAKGAGGQQGGQKGGQQGPPPVEGRKQVEDALPFQKQAKNDIQNKDTPKAGQQQQNAVDELERARKRLEEILKQLREEEIERLLAQLQARCEYMLQLQKEIYEGTIRLDKTIGENPGKKSTRPDELASGKLAEREGLVLLEATRARELIVSEGSAVAFAEVFTQLIDDIKLAQKNLNKTDVGLFTQKVERDIIDTLIEMIEALKKAQQEMKQQQQQQQGQPPPPGQQQQKLIDLLAELKMIRSMQIRVNKRTEDYGKLFPGEQADVPDIQKELHNLADRQDKIRDIVNKIATGKNQ